MTEPTVPGHDRPLPAADCIGPTDLALARSVLYGAVTLAFRLPTDETVGRLTSATARQAIEAAAELVDAARTEAEPVLPAVRQFIHLRDVAAPRLADSHYRLFGHTARGVVCPFETEYGAAAVFRQPQELADIAGYYLAFGLRPKSGVDERVDYVGCECEFMDFLSRKEALALERCERKENPDLDANREMLEETRKAERRFVRDHLGRFGRAFASALAREDQGEFFGAVGNILLRFLGLECERLHVPAGPAILELRSTSLDDAPMACGTGDELIQIQRGRPVEDGR